LIDHENPLRLAFAVPLAAERLEYRDLILNQRGIGHGDGGVIRR
jgi:hypothetical protein